MADHFSALRRGEQGIVGDSILGKVHTGEEDKEVYRYGRVLMLAGFIVRPESIVCQ